MTAGRAVTTLQKYVRGKSINATERQSVMYAMLKDKSRVFTNSDGTAISWNVKYNSMTTTEYEDLETRDYNPIVLQKRASVGWALYDNSSSLSKMDKLVNKGQSRMTDMLQEQLDDHIESMVRRFCVDFYVDGTGSNKILGRASFLGAGSTLSNGWFNPSDAYAGISTALGNYGGSAPTGGTWPYGYTETPTYDFHSPLLASSTSTNWSFDSSSPNNTWAAQCIDILKECKFMSDRNAGVMSGRVETVAMATSYFAALARQIELKEQMLVGQQKLRGLNLGYETLNFWGMEIVHDYWVPEAEAHGINWDVMELHSLQGDLFTMPEQVYEHQDKSYRIGCDFYGQLLHKRVNGQFQISELGA